MPHQALPVWRSSAMLNFGRDRLSWHVKQKITTEVLTLLWCQCVRVFFGKGLIFLCQGGASNFASCSEQKHSFIFWTGQRFRPFLGWVFFLVLHVFCRLLISQHVCRYNSAPNLLVWKWHWFMSQRRRQENMAGAVPLVRLKGFLVKKVLNQFKISCLSLTR